MNDQDYSVATRAITAMLPKALPGAGVKRETHCPQERGSVNISQITMNDPKVKDWIGKNGEVLTHKMNPKFGELFLIVRYPEMQRFLRCFHINEKVVVSVDFECDPDDGQSMASFLLERHVS